MSQICGAMLLSWEYCYINQFTKVVKIFVALYLSHFLYDLLRLAVATNHKSSGEPRCRTVGTRKLFTNIATKSLNN